MPKYLPNAEPFFFPGHCVETVIAISTPLTFRHRLIPLFRISSLRFNLAAYIEQKPKLRRAAASIWLRVLTEISSG
jgi:hypothetical protein